jgi:glycosyltransferase involved in cell wall biosynthesis
MRIVIDVRHIRDFGIGTYIRNLVHALAVVDHDNRYVLTAAPDDARTLAGLPDNFSTAVYNRSDRDRLDHAAYPAFLRRLGPDLVHVPLNRVPLGMIRPYVVTIHDMASLLFDERRGTRMTLWRYWFRRGLARAERVIAVSDATRRDVQRLLGIPADQVSLVYNAPSPEFFMHRRVADARAAGPATESLERKRIMERYQIQYPFVLYVGNIRPQKNIPRLVEAFAVLRERLADHPDLRDVRLIIIGDEISRYPSVRRAVIQSRVEHAVRFLGFVPFDTLRCFYESALVFVFPSLYEGFGLPPLEAMASGTPVVTSSISSLPEVVGDAAMLVNPENVFDIARGILEVLLDERLRQELIRKGREHAARYSWERTAREVRQIYEEVGERHGKKS